MRGAVLVSLVAVGCGYSESTYLEDYATASCDFTVACYPDLYASVADCVASVAGGEGTIDCTFDAEAARSCVEGVETMECPGEGEFPAFPAACANVYTDCPAPE
jgi:hypothetical protein